MLHNRLPTDEEAFRSAYKFQTLTNAMKTSCQTENALKQLETLADWFYRLALDDRYQSSLSENVEDALQNSLRDFNDWVQRPSTQLQYFFKGPTKLILVKIVIVKMARFIIWKFFGHPSMMPDLAMITVNLLLDTCTLCHQQQCWLEMQWCFQEISSYDELQPTQLPANQKIQHYKNLIKLAVLRVHYAYGTMKPSCDGLVGFHVRKLKYVELDDHQLQEMSEICYYMGYGHFSKDCVSAQPWLKSAYHFAKRMNAVDRSANTFRALVLLVKCLLKDDPILHRDMILHLIGLLDENITAAELRMETWLAGKSQIEPTIQCAAKLFCLYLTEGTVDARNKIVQVFDNLKKMGHTLVIIELLNRIPWRNEGTDATDCLIPTSLMPQMRWILAEVAVLSCVMNHDQEECLRVLKDIALWIPNKSSVSTASLSVIIENAKSEAFDIGSPQETLTWCQVLVEIGRRNGLLDTELLIGTVWQSICLKVEETVSWGQEILNSIKDPDTDFQLLRFKLFIAIRDKDEKKAMESCLLLETKYEKEKRLDSTEWEEVFVFLEKSVEIGLEHGISQVVIVRCLNALDQELDRRIPYTIDLLTHVARFVDKILSHHCKADSTIVERKCVDLLVKMVCQATRLLTILDGEEILWFGGFALSLASNTSVRTTPLHRHLLYKCRYKLLNLNTNKDEKLKEDIRNSICNSMAAGITFEGQPNYVDVLNSALECVTDYTVRDSVPVRLYEYYILCQLGDVTRVEEAVERHSSEGSPFRLNARFFSSLAGLASSDHRSHLRSILPENEKFVDEYHKPRDQNLQRELTEVAIKCMRKSIRLQINSPLREQSISSSWQMILLLAQENIFLQNELLERCSRTFQEYLDFIRANRELFDTSDISLFLEESWNITLNIIHHKGKEAADMWVKLMCEVAELSAELGGIMNDFLSRLPLS